MEAMVRGKTAEHQGEVDEHLKAQQARLLMVQEKQRLQSRCLDLKQRALPAFMPQSTGSTSILCIYIYIMLPLLGSQATSRGLGHICLHRWLRQ